MKAPRMSAAVTGEVEMPQSGAERTRRYRERLAANGGPQLKPCLACGRMIQTLQQGERGGSDAGLLCNPCWRKSPAGKAFKAEQKRQLRARAKAEQQSPQP